jgi:hypothetical protein
MKRLFTGRDRALLNELAGRPVSSSGSSTSYFSIWFGMFNTASASFMVPFRGDVSGVSSGTNELKSWSFATGLAGVVETAYFSSTTTVGGSGGNGSGLRFTLRIGGVNTALVFDVPFGSSTATLSSQSVAIGVHDRLTIQCTHLTGLSAAVDGPRVALKVRAT